MERELESRENDTIGCESLRDTSGLPFVSVVSVLERLKSSSCFYTWGKDHKNCFWNLEWTAINLT